MESQHPIPRSVMDRLAVKTAETRIAVVGASTNPEKYGNIIPGNLKGKGYTVLPVNPKAEEIQGLSVYASPAELPDPVHIVDMVTPPEVTRAVLEALDPHRFETIWLQDGSFDDELVAFAEAKFDTVVHHACIMVVTNY